MFIRKSTISKLIKREREKERLRCEKEYNQKIHHLRKEFEKSHAETMKKMKKHHEHHSIQLNNKIQMLKKEIERNHAKYQEIRMRESGLDDLSVEMENEVNKMVIKIHESLQPFYRTVSKVEAIKRKSDKKHEKIENIFSVVK
ncbi:MAG: hypothetical protein SVZ03_15875 [Spirochaetota bacterium]|nr:hypothetical protein [Spirochaetota bacterium]